MLESIGLALALAFAEDSLLRAGKDVPIPQKISQSAAEYPGIAREIVPMPVGIVVLDVGVNETGKVTDIKVVRGTPILDMQAIEAVKKWTYAPTRVDGMPRRVAVVEVVEMFPDENSRWDFFLGMLKDRKESSAYRVLALDRIKNATGKRLEKLQSTLLKLSKEEPDESVRTTVTQALAQLERK